MRHQAPLRDADLIMNGIETLSRGISAGCRRSGLRRGNSRQSCPLCLPPDPHCVSLCGLQIRRGEDPGAGPFCFRSAMLWGWQPVYSLLGMVAALTGGFFGRISTSPWALLIVANILILIALNILEVIPFPIWFSGRSPGAGRGRRGRERSWWEPPRAW